MDTSIDRLNTALAGRYVISGVRGQGGMATVYSARDIRHDRDVAIKVLAPELAEALGAERFLKEIKTTASLRHPHILPLFDSGAADGMLFYVMPLVDGETLRDRLTREKQLPIADALRIAAEVSDALSYAHARGVIHRDIKPENILLEGGHAVVADFGIARAVSAAGDDRLTHTGVSIGTPVYMSPEQAAGGAEVDGRSDLYSLACVLYEMLGGEPPFTGPTMASVVRQHMAVDAPPITNLRPAVPAHVAGALQRALAKSPVDRFNPVAQFSAALATPTIEPSAAAAAASAPSPAAHIDGAGGKSRRIAIGVAGLLLLAVIAGWLLRGKAASPSTSLTSVAVLPFSDLSPDKSSVYLGDGIAETLISALTNVTGITVAARTSAFSFRDGQASMADIGRALSVGTVLEGSVQRAADKLRITARLVKASDGVTIWSQTFDRSADDIFAVQDEVVRAVVTTLQGRAYATNARFESTVGTKDREAYDLYLQGLYFWNRRSLADFMRAQALFERAIARDSAYGAPWAGISHALITQAFVDTTSAPLLLGKARAAAERALRLAPDQPDAHAALAYLLFLHDWNYEAADSAFRSVNARYPSNVMGHKWYADVLNVLERRDEMWAQLREALALDPKLAITMFNIGSAFEIEEKLDSALVWYERGLEVAPDLVLALAGSARIHGQRGDSAATFAALERLARASTLAVADLGELRRAWGRGGYKAMLRAWIASPGSGRQRSERARALAMIGDYDGAFRDIEEAIVRREIWSPFTVVYRAFDPMRSDPRWNALRRRLKLPDERIR